MTAGLRPEPLRLTFARWYNVKKITGHDHDGMPVEKWDKKLAHNGSLTQFAYGSDTPSEWGRRVQRGIIAALHTGVIVIDVDDWAWFALTPLGRALAARGLPASHRGPDRCHYVLDARGVPPGRWPAQHALYGDKDIGHCKSAGFVPVPGSEHGSGVLYEPVLNAAGLADVIIVDEELLGLIGQAASYPAAAGGHGGSGGEGRNNHLTAVKGAAIARGLTEDQANAEVLRANGALADPLDPGELAATVLRPKRGWAAEAAREAAWWRECDRLWGVFAWLRSVRTWAASQPSPALSRMIRREAMREVARGH
jgi:hypothetical protein